MIYREADTNEQSQAEGTARPSIASKYLQELEDTNRLTPERVQALKGVLGAMYVGGYLWLIFLLAALRANYDFLV
jgi:hypothetical protein